MDVTNILFKYIYAQNVMNKLLLHSVSTLYEPVITENHSETAVGSHSFWLVGIQRTWHMCG